MTDTPLRKYDIDIYDVCATIHSAYIGASDPMTFTEISDAKDMLDYRLKVWTLSSAKSRDFDEAIKALIKVALTEVAHLLAARSAN